MKYHKHLLLCVKICQLVLCCSIYFQCVGMLDYFLASPTSFSRGLTTIPTIDNGHFLVEYLFILEYEVQ